MAEDDHTVFRPAEQGGGPETPGPAEQPIEIPGVQITGRLGEGGMAVVYEGLDEGFSPPRRVAVKVMGASLSADPEFRARFEQEASLVADFRHDNIIHVYASGEVAGEKYLVMEYLPGGVLSDKLEQGSLPTDDAIRIALAMAGALDYSHSRGIVHRDFKPGNVLFTAEGKPVLSDFGVAKVTTRKDAALTRHASVIGAARYMAPEQELGEEVTDRADVYSWGLTLFEMLDGDPLPSKLRQIHGTELQSALASQLLGAPESVTTLLSRCLSVDPAGRPAAAECQATLRSLTQDDNRSVTTEVGPAAAAAKRRRWLLPGILGLSALIAVGWLVRGLIGQEPEPAPSPLDMDDPPAQTQPDPGIEVPINPMPASAALYLDGSPISGPAIRLDPGEYQLVAVADRHYGDISRIAVASGIPASIDVALVAHTLPSVAELQRFFQLSDAASISYDEVAGIEEPALRSALETKLLTQTGRTSELNALQQRLETLSRFGDARAASSQVLAAAIRDGRIHRGLLVPEVFSAADSGDALASFLVAVAIRDSLREHEIEPSNAEFQAYCGRLNQVRQQGWPEMAVPMWERDGCGR